MKKNLFYYLFAVLCTVTLFASCSDDDDNPSVTIPIEQDIVGAYKGKMDVYYVGVADPIGSGLSQKVYVSKASDTAIKLELRNFVFNGLSLGNITLDNCPVTEYSGAYKFSGSQKMALLVGDCEVTVSGSVNNNTIEMTINVKVGDGVMQVKVDYEGTKLAGNESSEAKISSFLIDSEIVTEQPAIDNENGTITFKVIDSATSDDLVLTPTFQVSDGATASPASGVVQDFSDGKSVEYTVVAEDGTTKKYVASIIGKTNILKYSFEDWGEQSDKSNPDKMKWFSPLPLTELATANNGVAYLKAFDFGNTFNLSYGTTEEKEAGYNGSAAKLITQYTKGAAFGMAPAITPGSLFTGSFDFKVAIDPKEQLKMTKFGIPYAKKPLYFKGAYKYKAGEKFVDGSNKEDIKEDTGDIDQCGIYALLYEATDKNGDDIILDGITIANSEYRVAIAQIQDGSDTEDQWIEFNETFTYFEGKSYDSSKKYKMAIVCSSSKAGDSFKGAVNSTLFVDELEVIGE